MSRLNGDKSRFNRLRKQKLGRRKRTRALVVTRVTSGGQTSPGSTPEANATRRKGPE
jgi:hypothetical protein